VNETLEKVFESWADHCLPSIPKWETMSQDARNEIRALAWVAFYSGAANMYRMCRETMSLKDEKAFLERWQQLNREIKNWLNQGKK
jgi:hypothetical protein